MQWRDVLGYEGIYKVSDTGEILSLERDYEHMGKVHHKKPRLLSKHINEDGYYMVKLSRGGQYESVRVHKLVAQAYCDGYQIGYEVNHKNFDRLDNRASNLEWVSHEDNIAATLAAGRHFTQIYPLDGANNPRAIAIRMEDMVTGQTVDFNTIGECADYLILHGYTKPNVHTNAVRSWLRRRMKKGLPTYGCRFYEM